MKYPEPEDGRPHLIRPGCPWSVVEDLAVSSSGARSLRVDFAVQRQIQLLLPLLVGLSVGCSGPQQAAKYAWIRKQGPLPKEHPLDRAGPPATAIPGTGVLVQEHATGTAPDAFETGSLSAAVPSVAFHGALSRMPTGALPEPEGSTLAAIGATILLPSNPVQDTTSYYAPEKHRWNAKAIASLPIAVATVVVGFASQSIFILLAGGVVAFVLGLISARQCRDREDRGKGFALAAMILGAAAMFFSIMVIILAA